MWIRLDPRGPVRTHMGPLLCGPMWAHMATCGPVWIYVDSLGPIWTHVAPYGPVLDPYGSISLKQIAILT